MDILEKLRGWSSNPERKLGAATFVAGALMLEAADEIERLKATERALAEALEVLLGEAVSFSVSGVYFDEDCMGHKGPALARAALDLVEGASKP